MTDKEVLDAVHRARRAYKSSLTKAARLRAKARKEAFARYGSADVEQAARSTAIRRVEIRADTLVDRARDRYCEKLNKLRQQAGQWSDLVPSCKL
jgi:hypothetical protein